MSRALTLGNGNMLVGFDYKGQVRDFYYPFVGHANHVSGASGSYVHRIGVFVEGKVHWLDDPSWVVNVSGHTDSVVGSLHAVNEELGLTLTSTDVIHNEKNVLLRSFVINNEKNEAREVKFYISQQFRIAESRRGDTAFYDPRVQAIIHYKGHDNFLITATHNGKRFTDYSIGLFDIEGKTGTYHDAEDGVLECNPIEHGSVDSVVGLTLELEPRGHGEVMYWIVAGATIDEVHQLDSYVVKETPEALIRSTENYWRAWINKEDSDLSLLTPELINLYKRSLLNMRVHSDNRGAIIASSDTDMLHHGRDTYSYVWPRDGALIALSFIEAGYPDVARKYFEFITKRIERGGYLMHKYRSDGVLGSSWHPWLQNGVPQLPIQEDETALTIFGIWQYYEATKDIEFLEASYNPFIEPAANFLCEHIEASLGLPAPSYDLWEEKFGISTYTACAVYGSLLSAAQAANVLGKQEPARTYLAVAQRMRLGILEHLYDPNLGMFIKLIRIDKNDDLTYDRTLDMSSFFGPVYFGLLEPDDERIKKSFETVEEKLKVNSQSSGYVRYVGDNYYKMSDADSPNPWVITTLWMAQFLIMKAKSLKELKGAYEILEWTCSHATPSGILAEQMHPHTRAHLSTAPLIWSHAEYVMTVQSYLKKHHELRGDN
jgi:oligosaccharide amylase